MSRFAFAHAVHADWGHACRVCLEALGPLPEGANLGFLYTTRALSPHLSSLLTALREITHVPDWVGAGADTIVVGAEVFEDEPALAVMVAALPEDSFRLLRPSGPAQPVAELLDPLAGWLERHGPPWGLVHVDPAAEDGAERVAELARRASAWLVGGIVPAPAGQPAGQPVGQPAAQLAGRVVEGGLSGVLFGAEVAVVAGLTQGCSPLAPAHRISEAAGNVLMSLDGRPALEVLKEEVGPFLARRLERLGGYVHAAFPVRGSDQGQDYVVRNLLGLDPTRGWIAVGEEVASGEAVMFVRRDGPAAKEDLARMLSDVRRRLPGEPKGALYVSCVARGRHLFPADDTEILMIREALGDIPLIGFRADGEVCHDRIYGYTGVLSVFV